jgi:glucose dehydrogenase
MRICYAVLLAAAALLPTSAQTPNAKPAAKPNPAADWPMYNRDSGGTRYSALTQISPTNVSNLQMAWKYRLSNAPAGRGAAPPPAAAPEQPGAAPAARGAAPAGGRGGGRGTAPVPTVNPEATPIVINGVMYLPAGGRVLALDADTGKLVWEYKLPTGGTSARGVAFWPGEGTAAPRIIFTAGPRLMAVNAITGEASAGFGQDGAVDIKVGWNGVPLIYKNVIMLGATVGEISQGGDPGDSRAYDARSGAKLWEFHSVPQPGEPGHETWLDDGWKQRSGVNVWGWYMTLDEQRGILYMPFGSPAGNYWGGDRPGNNLFGNSVVAVDALTGPHPFFSTSNKMEKRFRCSRPSTNRPGCSS